MLRATEVITAKLALHGRMQLYVMRGSSSERRTERPDRPRREWTAGRSLRPYFTAGVAIVGASVIAASSVTPIASAASTAPSEIRSVNSDVRLTAAPNILNVPYNLFADVFNVVQTENDAINFLARSLLFSGPWMVVSPTNLWGVDSGDPSHFQSVVNFMMPIKELSGIYDDEITGMGYGQQLWKLMAAILPVSGECDVESCTPMVPTAPITGITGIDQNIWTIMVLAGAQRFPLFEGWFTRGGIRRGVQGRIHLRPRHPRLHRPQRSRVSGFGLPRYDNVRRSRRRTSVGRHNIQAGFVRAHPDVPRPFVGRHSRRQPDQNSEPAGIRLEPTGSCLGDDNCVRSLHAGEPLLPRYLPMGQGPEDRLPGHRPIHFRRHAGKSRS